MRRRWRMRGGLCFAFALCLLVCFSVEAKAVITNPNPAVWFDDNHAQLFSHDNASVSMEVYDLFGSAQGWYSSFGFFFASAPATKIRIFGPADQGASLSQGALINFASGYVWDVDASNLESLFASSTDPIGFYLDLVSPAGNHLFLSTLSTLNQAGLDLAATFQSKTDPLLYLIGFEIPNRGTVAFDLVGSITAVPEPSTVLLLGAGVVMLAVGLRKRHFR